MSQMHIIESTDVRGGIVEGLIKEQSGNDYFLKS